MSEDRHDLQLQTDMKRLLLRWEKQSHVVVFPLQGANTPEEHGVSGGQGSRQQPLPTSIPLHWGHKHAGSCYM